MTKVLITLVPKRNVSKLQVLNLTPILLINTSLRIICLALNKRLLKVADQLIAKEQRGFLSSRYIDDNIAQVRNLAELTRNHYSNHQDPSASQYQAYSIQEVTKMAICMID